MHPRFFGRTPALDKAPEGQAGGEAPAPAPAEAKPSAQVGSPPEPPAAGTPPAPAAPEPTVQKQDWRDARIAELTAKLNDAKRSLQAQPLAQPQQKPGESQADFDARVNAAAAQKAQELQAMREWDARCNEVAAAGVKQFGEAQFFERYGNLKKLVNEQDPEEVNVYTETLAVAMETGKGHELLYSLGSQPDEWKRLMALPPVRRAMEMAKLASKLEAAPEPSKAPAPIEPVGSSGIHYDGIKPDDPKQGMKLDKKAWMEMRNKQARERGLQ